MFKIKIFIIEKYFKHFNIYINIRFLKENKKSNMPRGRQTLEGKKNEAGTYYSRIKHAAIWRDNNREKYLEYQKKIYLFRKEAKRLFAIEF